MEPFVGEICTFGFNFPPRGWAFCDGSLLSIAQNTALFSLLGTQYGGNGTTNFALPDLRGRVPVRFGQGPGLSDISIGEVFGSESVTLLSTEMPQHTHTASQGVGGTGTVASPVGALPASAASGTPYATSGTARMGGGPTAAGNLGIAGSSLPHENRMPSLVVNFCIALEGVFPARA